MEGFTASRPSRQERLALGKELRKAVPRAFHARYVPASDRADPVTVIQGQNTTRVRRRSLHGRRLVAAEQAARDTIGAYRQRIRRYAEMGFLEVWCDRIDERAILDAVPPRLRRRAEALIARARFKGHLQVMDRLTEDVDGKPRIVEEVPLIVRETCNDEGIPIADALDVMLRAYFESLPNGNKRLLSRYRIVDVARKVVGVGSVGTSCWVLFMQGLDTDDPLFLQVKEARASVLAPHVRTRLPISNHGHRVVAGQRLIQGSPDIFLGWGVMREHHFYVRQLADMKGGVRFIEGEPDRLDGFGPYCRLCGWALALAHAKSGDAAAIAGYCGRSEALDEAIGRFALTYLTQTEADHAALIAAASAGRIEVPTGFQVP